MLHYTLEHMKESANEVARKAEKQHQWDLTKWKYDFGGRKSWQNDEKAAQNLKIGSPTSASSKNHIRYGNETRPKNIALLYCIKY